MRSLGRIALPLLAAGSLVLGAAAAVAQERQKFSFKVPAGVTKFTRQHALDVGDRPGHVLRLLESHTKYTGDAPVYDGVKAVEMWNSFLTDSTDGNGRSAGYQIILLANGDRILATTETLSSMVTAADGSRKSSFTSIATLVGGSGRFVGMRGTLRATGVTDLKVGTSNVEVEGEYWIEK